MYKDRARRLCDELITAWITHQSREEALETVRQYLLEEREACAAVAEDVMNTSDSYANGWDVAKKIAGKIRERGL